jgi:hypothetical protein
MKDKSQKVSTEGNVAESKLRGLDGATLGCAERTAAPGSSLLQCIKASGENSATNHLGGRVQNASKNSDDRVRATSMMIGCNFGLLGVVDEDRTRSGSMEASSCIKASDGTPSENGRCSASKMNKLIIAGRNPLILVAKGLIRRAGKCDDPP